FQIECLTELPPSHQPPPGPSLCDLIDSRMLPVCPPCPSEPWVVLAKVTLPASTGTDIADNNIDNISVRRQIYSTAVLQDQLIKCCCARTAGKPDLVPVMTKPGFCDTDLQSRLLVTVKNQGTADAGRSTTRVTFHRTKTGSDITVEVPTPLIGVGQSITLPGIPIPPEAHNPEPVFTITVNAKPEDGIVESRTDNNTADGMCIG